ncbi:hypothetical protein [Lactobacillus taiwanensis]|nr:hypothetical protein [Lactobacillus taiwanensis]
MNSNVLSNYVFGETYFPHMAIPINRKEGDTIIFFESKQIIWKIEKQLKDKKKVANNLNVDSLMAVDAIDLIETFDSKYSFFLPDNVTEIRNMYYFGSLSTLGIQVFLTLKEATNITNLQPWVTMYNRLIDKAYNQNNLLSKNRLEISHNKLSKFSKYFDTDYQQKIKDLFSKEKAINHRILSTKDFML